MKERLEKLIDALNDRRAILLEEYLKALETMDSTAEKSMMAIDKAGFIHDIDRHITNLFMELRARETMPRKEVVHA